MKKFLYTFAFFWAFALSFAQSTTSAIKGSVKDQQGKTLPGASVVAIHTPSGTKYSSVSNADGRFSINNMRVGGPYKLEITFVGFQTYSLQELFLELGKPFFLDAKLASDSQNLQEVKVTSAKGKIFQNSRTGAETNIGRKELSALPTITRSASDFTRLEPSASAGSFGGRNDQFNNYSLNGAIFNNPFGLDAATPGGQTDSQPISIDAIDQIQVATAPYDVTMSGFTGASVNAVTKSGTNQIHGTAYSFYRNQDFTGSKVNGEKIFVPDLNQVQAGASLGGYIIKNKLFYFANIEMDKRSDLGSNVVANNNDGTIGVNESRVLASDLQMVSNALKGIGYDTGSYEGFLHKSESKKGIFKLDWNISDNHKLAFIYNFLDAFKEKPAHPTAINRRGPDANTLQFQNSGYRMNNVLNAFLLELNSKFSDNASNKIQAGYTVFEDSRDPFSAPAPVINILKDGSPYIIAGHEPFSIHNRLNQKVYQFTDNFVYNLDKHEITLGMNFEKFMFKNSFNLKGYGFDVFGSVTLDQFMDRINNNYYKDALANAQSIFNSKNLLQDGEDNGWNLAQTNVGQLSFYMQDEWNILDNFKFTYGLRVDKPLYFDTADMIEKFINTKNSESYNPNINYFDPISGKSILLDSKKLPSNAWLISPRLGFNWDVNNNKISQLRGGAGIFTGRLPFVWIGNQVSGVDQFFYQTVDNNFKFPQVFRASLGFDHKFQNNWILSVDASYNKDINGVHVQNWGLKNPTSQLAGPDRRFVYGPNDFGTWTSPWGSTERANAYVMTNSSKGYAVNTSVKIQKTFDNGLYTSLAYNFLDSKDVNSIEAEITGDAFNFNPALGNVNQAMLSNSKYGDKHRIIGVASKKWSYGNNNKWATTVTTFFEYAQGGRFSYTYGGDINNDGSGVNDLIFIPTKEQIGQMTFVAAGQAEAFDKFIEQDKYLSQNRGQYAQRYAALAPWRGKWDLKILQDLNINFSNNKTNTIQFSIDVLNVGNLINSNWGVVSQPVSVQPIGVTVVGNQPVYNFSGQQTKTFTYDASLASRWQAQFGIRYIF